MWTSTIIRENHKYPLPVVANLLSAITVCRSGVARLCWPMTASTLLTPRSRSIHSCFAADNSSDGHLIRLPFCALLNDSLSVTLEVLLLKLSLVFGLSVSRVLRLASISCPSLRFGWQGWDSMYNEPVSSFDGAINLGTRWVTHSRVMPSAEARGHGDSALIKQWAAQN